MIDVAIIIPTYEKHYEYLVDAVRSVDVYREIIVVNDSLERIDFLEDVPRLTIIDREDETPWGTGKARNIGANHTECEALIWLDSDDLFIPGAIQLLWDAYEKTKTPANPGGNIVYGDLIRSDTNFYWQVQDQYCGPDITQSGLIKSNRPYCCLISKLNHDEVGGYDETMLTWEDIDYEKKTTIAGMCETHLNGAIYYYRWQSGDRRNLASNEELKQNVSRYMYSKYEDYHVGRKQLMACKKCGDQAINVYRNNDPNNSILNKALPEPEPDEVQYLVYIGGDPTHSKEGPVTGLRYRWGMDKRHSRKKIVNSPNPKTNEVTRVDAAEFLPIRIHGRDQFKYQTEIVIGSTPQVAVTKTPDVPANATQPTENQGLNIFFDNDSVTNYSINAMREKIDAEEDEIPRSQLQMWLEEELRRGKDSRKGMEALLRDAIG